MKIRREKCIGKKAKKKMSSQFHWCSQLHWLFLHWSEEQRQINTIYTIYRISQKQTERNLTPDVGHPRDVKGF